MGSGGQRATWRGDRRQVPLCAASESCVSVFVFAYMIAPCNAVTGIYRNSFDAALNTKNGFPVFATIIEGATVVE